jgi:predicted transcriptional regulator
MPPRTLARVFANPLIKGQYIGDSLAALQAEYDNENQSTKRNIGEYLYNRPAQWIAQQVLASEFDLDSSGISKHLDKFHEDGYILSKKEDGERYVQWNGRGAGGLEYWARELIPGQL